MNRQDLRAHIEWRESIRNTRTQLPQKAPQRPQQLPAGRGAWWRLGY